MTQSMNMLYLALAAMLHMSGALGTDATSSQTASLPVAFPDVVISLASPVEAMPALRAAIQEQERALQRSRAAGMNRLREAFRQVAHESTQSIALSTGSSLQTSSGPHAASFVSVTDSLDIPAEASIDVAVAKVAPETPGASQLVNDIAAAEARRIDRAFIEATKHLQGLATAVVRAYQDELNSASVHSRNALLLETTVGTHNWVDKPEPTVRVAESTRPVQSEAALIEAMVERLAVSDRLASRKFLDIELQLCKVLIKAMQAASSRQ